MTYDATLTITVPASLYDTACAISRALDPDSGGYASWGPRTTLDEAGNELTPDSYTTSTPCTSEFKAQAVAMLANPAMLHGAVKADYLARWPDLTPPTLEQCAVFCAAVSVVTTAPGQAEFIADKAEVDVAIIQALLDAVTVTDEPAMTTMARMGLVIVTPAEATESSPG